MTDHTQAMLDELTERDRIRELVHRYCWAVDRGTLEDVMALFDDACDLLLIPGSKRAGRGAVERWYGRYMSHRLECLRHLIHNQIITLDGDRATSKSYFDAVGGLRGESIVVGGFYEDTLRKVDGRWKFSEKIIRVDFMVPLSEGWGGEKIKTKPWWYD
jgi:ketosteroid isomerase-like protein